MKTIISIMVLAIVADAANAGIEWSWTNAGTGTEQGTFVTEGELVGDEAPAGTYTIWDFTVTASGVGLPLGSSGAGDYYTNMPEMGFDWDGSSPTVFWRLSGVYTNGFGWYASDPIPGGPDMITFGVDFFQVEYDEDVTFIHEEQTAIILPEMTVTATAQTTFSAVKALFN